MLLELKQKVLQKHNFKRSVFLAGFLLFSGAFLLSSHVRAAGTPTVSGVLVTGQQNYDVQIGKTTNLTISGTNLDSVTTLVVDDTADIAINNIVKNSTTLTFDVVVSSSTPTGLHTVFLNGQASGIKGQFNVITPGSFSDFVGSGLLGFINKIIVGLLGLLNEAIYFIFYWLIAPLIQAMLSIHVYQDKFVNVIYPGWIIVRNICNIAFIVAIIAIALATLFRVSGYQLRSLLIKLVIAALLVNFSLVIGQAILGIADTVQSQFLPDNITVIRSLARDLMVTNTRDAVFNISVTNLGSFSYTVVFLFWVALALGSFLVFAAICVLLIIRMVALWVLLMLSPVAYVAGILPSTEGARSKWWEEFLKYAFFTPIMAFFLNLTALISDQVRAQGLLQSITNADFSTSNAPAVSVFVFKVGSNVVLLILLIVAIRVADFFGIYGAKVVSDVAERGVMAPFRAAGWGAGRGLGVLNDWKTRKSLEWAQPDAEGKVSFGKKMLFRTLNPATSIEGFKHQSEEKKQRLKTAAAGLAFDIGRQTKVFGGGPPSEEFHENVDKQVGAYEASNPYRTTDQMIAHYNEIQHSNASKFDKGIATEATVDQLAKNKDMNDLLVSQGFTADRQGYLMYLDEQWRSGNMSKARVARLAEKLSNHAFANNEFWYGWGSKDGKLIKVNKHQEDFVDQDGKTKKRWVFDGIDTTDRDSVQLNEDMLAQQQQKFAKKEPQELARSLHHSAVATADPDPGKGRQLSEVGADMILNADDRLYAQADRANKETVKAFISVFGNKDSYDNSVKSLAQSYQADAKKRNMTMTDSDARGVAEKQIKQFSEKFLRYDITSGSALRKERPDPIATMTDKYNLQADWRSMPENNRKEVQGYYKEVIEKPGQYTFNNTTIEAKITDNTVRNNIKNKVTEHISAEMAGNLNPADYPGLPAVALSDLKTARSNVATAIKNQITAHPDTQLGTVQMKQNLETAVRGALGQSAGFAALSRTQQDLAVAKILSDLK